VLNCIPSVSVHLNSKEKKVNLEDGSVDIQQQNPNVSLLDLVFLVSASIVTELLTLPVKSVSHFDTLQMFSR